MTQIELDRPYYWSFENHGDPPLDPKNERPKWSCYLKKTQKMLLELVPNHQNVGSSKAFLVDFQGFSLIFMIF